MREGRDPRAEPGCAGCPLIAGIMGEIRITWICKGECRVRVGITLGTAP